MEKKDFQKLCKGIFKSHGFLPRGNNFYFDAGEDLLVFGLQHSLYGSYYYIEYGVADKRTNQHMPWPKYYQVGLRRWRINFHLSPEGDPQAVFYADGFDAERFTAILEDKIRQAKADLA